MNALLPCFAGVDGVAAGWLGSHSNDATVHKVFWKVWEILGDDYPPVITDKLMFLVGAGKFVMCEPNYKCESRYEKFCQHYPMSSSPAATT